MKRIGIISITALSLCIGSTALVFAQRGGQQDDKDRPAQEQGKPEQAKPAEPPQDRKAQQDRVKDQRQKDTAGQQQRVQQQQQSRQQQQDQLKQREQTLAAQGARVAPARQQQLVTQQQTRLTQYRQHLDQQQGAERQRTTQLQQQKRTAQFRYQQSYLAHMRQQQAFLVDHHPDYDRDPFFFTLSTFRYNRGGRFYETNQYGADLLRQAVNLGYQEGFNTGAADREDRWQASYQDSYAYQDANYGYNGYYVERDDYNYYFREGFRRGYDDGYNSRGQYGRVVSGSHVMLEITLSDVLGFQAIR